MKCDKCEGKKPTRKLLENTDFGTINWCEECIEGSEAVKMTPMKENGLLMAVDSGEVRGYGDYSVEYIESESDLKQGQRLIYDAKVINKHKVLEKTQN